MAFWNHKHVEEVEETSELTEGDEVVVLDMTTGQYVASTVQHVDSQGNVYYVNSEGETDLTTGRVYRQ